MDRLFPNLEIKHDTATGTSSESVSPLAPTKAEDGNGFITCAMMRLQRVTLDNNFKNRIYFKSEVVAKGENYGWVMWTGLSTLPEKGNGSNNYAGSLNFLHKLLLLVKEKDEWKIQRGYGWFDFFEQTLSASNFTITTPFEEWFSPQNPRGYLDSDEKDFPEIREWAGVAEISNSSNARTLMDSIAVYKNGAEYAEFWGNGGKFTDVSQGLKGYHTAVLEYVDGVGWRDTAQRDISSDLNTWYGSFVKDKKVVWSDLVDRCDSWSKKRNRKVSSSEDSLRSLCYKDPTPISNKPS